MLVSTISQLNIDIDATSLTADQVAVSESFMQFISRDDQKEMAISGSAGTGKTYLIRYLIKCLGALHTLINSLSIESKDKYVFVTATTNKAVSVLKNKIPEIMPLTIHSLLGLKVEDDYEKGIQKLVVTKDTKTIKNSIIFVDEASMVDYQLLQLIRQMTAQCKIIYVGDADQLLPVFSKSSPVFAPFQVDILETLNEQVRQKNKNNLLDLALHFKKGIHFKQEHLIKTDLPEIECISVADAEKRINKEFSDNAPANKILAWTNNQVKLYNQHVRLINNFHPYLFEIGEWVICNKPLLGAQGTILTHTDEEVKIVSRDENLSVRGIPYIGYTVLALDGTYHYACQPKNPNDFNLLLKKFAANKNWRDYFDYKNNFSDLRSNYALTIHKSQGSTYKTAFIDLRDIGKNNKWYEVARLLYVAVTRVTDKIYFIGQLPEKYRKVELSDDV